MANTSAEPPQFQISQIPPPPPPSSSESGPPPPPPPPPPSLSESGHPPPPPPHNHQSQHPTESEQQQLTSESEDVIPPPPPAPENFDALLMDSGKSDVAPASTTSTNNSQALILSKGFFDGITLPKIDPFVVADSVLFQPALYLFKVSLLPVNLATSLMTPDEDKALEYAAALAIQNMKKIPTLTSSSTLLIAALKLFDELRLNSIRPLFKKRIQQIIVFIGQSSSGLYSYCTQYSKVFTAEHLYKLENHIYKAMKCFKKFTRDDFVQHTFCGKEPQINFGTFEKDTLQECLNLTDLFNFKNKYLLPVQLSYYVVCDLKNGVLNAASDPQAMTTMGQVDFGLQPGSEDYENFQAEVYKTANSILELQTEAELLCSYYPAEIIANKAMRNFWKKNFEKAVTATLVDFESSIYSDLKAFGEEDTSALALAYALVYAIKTTTTPSYKLYEEEHINYLELDRMLRPIDPNESLTNTVTELTTKIVSNSCRLVPKHIATLDSIFGATNLSEVVWDDFQRDEMVTVFNSNTGWISVCGPKFCGKTCRILDALSLIPIDRDCVYIDMAKVSTEMECTSRIVSQLHLMECNTKESFTSKFNTFLSELKFGSVVVFDNLDGDDKDETISSFSSFASSILKHCEPFETSLCFVIVGRHMTNLSFAVQTINIPPLQAEVAVKFAQSLLPADPVALAKASQGLPGLMYHLTMKCNLDTIRAIASNVTADPSTLREVYGPNAGGMSYDVNASLGDDERLLASCFLKVSASFGPAMSWYMAKANFKDDITRWYLAWKGLVAKGWLSADGVINYFVPREATISSSADGSAPTMEEQWQRYCMFWAQHIQDVSFCCEESLMPWEDFDQFRQHYKNMLGYFFKQQNSSETPFVNLTELAFILSGCIVRLLNFRFSPEGGVLLANAIVASIDSTVETNAVAYLKAVTDLAVQMRRAERSVEAIRLMEKVQKSHEKLVTDGEVLGRFFAVLGNLHHSKNRLRKADEIYTKALQQWDSIGLTEDTHRANKLTKERQEVLRQQRGCKTCTIS